jgi:(aminoalkyl)phosphonate N-acetyltransferase
VAGLLVELGRPEVRGADEERHRDLFLSYLERDDTVALVADEGGEVVGFLDMDFRQRLNYEAPQAWIPDLVVSEQHRSRGHGGALLQRAVELARERGCWSIQLESANWRMDAHRFYLREGLTDFAKSFGKQLP